MSAKGILLMYEYACKVERVVDGDTVDCHLDLGFGIVYSSQRIRLYGIDAPESRTRDLVEKKYGLLAKEFLTEQLRKAEETGTLMVRTYLDDKGKFGRILGSFIFYDANQEEVDLNQYMVEMGHAADYFGQNKEEIKEQLIQNRYIVDNNARQLVIEAPVPGLSDFEWTKETDQKLTDAMAVVKELRGKN